MVFLSVDSGLESPRFLRLGRRFDGCARLLAPGLQRRLAIHRAILHTQRAAVDDGQHARALPVEPTAAPVPTAGIGRNALDFGHGRAVYPDEIVLLTQALGCRQRACVGQLDAAQRAALKAFWSARHGFVHPKSFRNEVFRNLLAPLRQCVQLAAVELVHVRPFSRHGFDFLLQRFEAPALRTCHLFGRLRHVSPYSKVGSTM